MRFGKYKGLPLIEVDDDYLEWLVTVARPSLKKAVLVELERRGLRSPDRDGLTPIGEIIQHWWREMVLTHHPDRGGDAEIMKALNNAHQRLKQLAGLATANRAAS
jgi:uncharacterized protein (DUF3820 family)